MHSAAVPLPPEVRALTVLDTVPVGAGAMPVLDDRNAPHLRRGEVAIIDPQDCVLVHGELFAVLYGSGPTIMQACGAPGATCRRGGPCASIAQGTGPRRRPGCRRPHPADG